ncbi:MAG: diacylglycerol kinase family lipid kinase [Anaerolineales bacterium]|nr:diacylglycerol kinase family lipid kinase [Anaerolineales bacterium]
MPHTTQLIFNPMADRGHSGERASDLRAMVADQGGADWHGTEYPAQATEVAARAADNGYTTLVALGGDGTVHEVINGLMRIAPERRPRLAIVPIGSGNDFSFAAGVAANPQEAVRRAFTGSERWVDVALIRDGSGRSEYFCNTCGIGFDAAVNIRTRKVKFFTGFFMYLTATLQTIARNFIAPHMQVQFDGGALDQPILMLTVGNGPREGGGFKTTPAARVDDGLLDFVYISQVSQFRMLQLLPKVMNATHVTEPDVKLGTTTRLRVSADRALPIHIDGELFAPYEANVRAVEIEIVPRAICLVA